MPFALPGQTILTRGGRRVVVGKARASGPPSGQRLFTESGTFIVPAGVTSICAVAIGAGARGRYNSGSGYWASGGGGGLACSNGLPVTPLETLTISIGEFGDRILARSGGEILLDAGGGGGTTDSPSQGGRGRVGQVLRTGGNGHAAFSGDRKDGGGAAGYSSNGTEGQRGGTGNPRGGGGVNPYALGAGAAGGAATGYDGDNYGGGGGLDGGSDPSGGYGNGGLGCVYIIYGDGRSFPSNAAPV